MLDIQFIQSQGDGHVFFTPECDSTQLEIQRFIEAGAMGLLTQQVPLLLYTHFQHKGFGQRGSEWLSERGSNLLMTVAFPLHKNKENLLVNLNKALSVSVAETMDNFTHAKVSIKWPNDIIYNHLKLGGILMETAQLAQHKYLLVGLGINVNQGSFPDFIPATSLRLLAEESQFFASAPLRLSESNEQVSATGELGFEKSTLLEQLAIAMFDKLQDAWSDPDKLVFAFSERLYGRNEWVDFLDMNSQMTFRAQVLDVNEQGQIVVCMSDGKLAQFHHGQVRMMYQKRSKI